jgi:NADH-quinone oxidoreductase subunit M
VSLDEFHGLYEHTPTLAALFLLTGLASIGFPGTVGFIGTELLIEGAVTVYPLVGMAVVVATALNGIAILHAYFRVFTGAIHMASIPLRARPCERIAVLILAVLILGGGLFPQPGVSSRYHAAAALIKQRRAIESGHDGIDSGSHAANPSRVTGDQHHTSMLASQKSSSPFARRRNHATEQSRLVVER